MKFLKLFFLIALVFAPQVLCAQDGWQQLITDNLEGWTRLNGEANYYVEEGIIVGEAVANTPNSFLTTDKEYGDFILEFEVKVDPRINSGVQIRSLSTSDYRDGRVHGYQVELDPSNRSWSGGIYDEARRGWLYKLTENPSAREAFQNGKWNKVRVEAVGSHINTWINGIHAARLVDDMTARGFIGLQVHSIGNDKATEGAQIKWRNMRIRTTELEEHRQTPDPRVKQISYLKNELTEWEKDHGWRLLWDGKTSAGWRGAKLDDFPESGWVMTDGVLTILQTDGKEATGPGDIVTKEQFSDFELELEFKITEGANSGIKYFVDPDLNKSGGSAIGTEYQILDDQRHSDATKGVGGNRTVASLYDLIPAKNLSVPSRDKPFKGVGEWNKARIVSRDGHVEHWLNNAKVVEYNRFSQIFAALVEKSKYKDWKGFGRWLQGPILLQDHGNRVSYRSIKIKEL